MKRKTLISFIILFFIFFSPIMVNADTRCIYTWENTPNYDEVTFTLTAEGNSSELTVFNNSVSRDMKLGETDNGVNALTSLSLNSDGSCPTISIYEQRILGGFKIYESNSECKAGMLTKDDNCSPNLTGTIDTSGQSESSASKSGLQLELDDSNGASDGTCTYTVVEESGIIITINVTEDNATCDSTMSDYNSTFFCYAQNNVKSDFTSSGSLTCPAYIYTTAEDRTEVAGILTYIHRTYTIYETGDEEDEDRTSTTSDAQAEDWEQLDDDAFNIANDEMECEDIFDNSFGELLNTLLNYIRIIGPILVVLLSALDFIKAVVSSDEKAMKQAQSKLVIRLVAAICLFLVPTLVQLLLSFINATVCLL